MEQSDDSDFLRLKVDKIENEERDLKKQKEEIQSDCQHKGETFVQFDETNAMKKYCSACKATLGYPSKEEADKFLGNK